MSAMGIMVVAAMSIALALPAVAQPTGGGAPNPIPVAGAPRRGGQPNDRVSREQLEREIRENFTRRIQRELRLTDNDMVKLAAVNRRFDAERRRLVQEERQARIAMRNSLEGPDSTANQARVGELLDQMLRITRARLNLMEQEQRELSTFMTPVQRARYQGMVEWLQRRMDDLSDRGRGGRGDGRGDGRPGGGGRGGPPRGGGGRAGSPPPPTTPPPGAVQRTPPPGL